MTSLPVLDEASGNWILKLPVQSTYTLAEASRILGVTRVTIARRVDLGVLEANEDGAIFHSSILEAIRLQERRIAAALYRAQFIARTQEDFK